MYQIAEENGVENLVAGAWGCGVFMQDPYTVATLLIGAARNYNIPNIYTDSETKVVCRAKNKDDLLRAVEAAKELGMEEYKDYFLIYDACRTELEKESPLVLGLGQWKLRRLEISIIPLRDIVEKR